MYHYIIVGGGIAGWNLAWELRKRNRRFIVFDTGKNNSTLASAGLYNPVILKRFTPAWKATEFLDYALLQYRSAEMYYGKQIVYPFKIYRKIQSAGEQNQWDAASQHPELKKYMRDIVFEKIPGIEAPFGFGVLENTGMVDTASLLEHWKNELRRDQRLLEQNFDHAQLQFHDGYVEYQGLRALNIIFAEGFGMKKNPFFQDLPMTGTKGEALIVQLEKPLQVIVKSNIFLAPVPGQTQTIAGSTYDWTDKSVEPTAKAREHLTEKLKVLYRLPFKITGQKAGIRPTVKDRRPLLGNHPLHRNIWLFNGLGTRGIILAPKLASTLLDHIEFNFPLLPETDIRRFDQNAG